jgi:hypothetical protein
MPLVWYTFLAGQAKIVRYHFLDGRLYRGHRRFRDGVLMSGRIPLFDRENASFDYSLIVLLRQDMAQLQMFLPCCVSLSLSNQQNSLRRLGFSLGFA